MKIAVLIPDRNDRPNFLQNCLRMIDNQTLKPDIIELVNFIPTDSKCDITKRYRIGYDNLRNKEVDIICLIENDDYYHPEYIETMVNKWVESEKPDLLGTNNTIYYHLYLNKYFTMRHNTRSSAMNTLIKPDLNFKWCNDNEAYTDIHLWRTLTGIIFEPNKIISLGIKHGNGLCGGRTHTDNLHRFVNNDENYLFLKSIMDKESLKFYING